MQSEGGANTSTVETSGCVDGCDRLVESSLVLSEWRFSVGGGMRLIHEICVNVSIDLSTRRNWYVFEPMSAMILYGPNHMCMNDSQ